MHMILSLQHSSFISVDYQFFPSFLIHKKCQFHLSQIIYMSYFNYTSFYFLSMRRSCHNTCFALKNLSRWPNQCARFYLWTDKKERVLLYTHPCFTIIQRYILSIANFFIFKENQLPKKSTYNFFLTFSMLSFTVLR